MNDVPSSDDRPTVELSSQSSPAGGEQAPVPGPQKERWFKDSKTLGLIGGIIALLIVIGLGVYAALRPPQDELKHDGKSGVFGELPGSGERPVSRDSSGLSGRSCDEPNRRAIGVMMPSDPITRPASGFADADLVVEMPVLVNDVTRLTTYYQCGQPTEIGSVRSARHDYLFVAEGFDAILGHWGGSYHALNRIAAGEFQTLNALENPSGAYYRKSGIPAPHNGFTSYENLWNALQEKGYRTETRFEGYDFKDDPAEVERGAAGTLDIAWPGAYRVTYEYDPVTNRYQRYWAGVKQVDGLDGADVAPSVVAIMRAENGPAEGPGGYNDVDVEGEGVAEIYQDGQVIKGSWRKDKRYKDDPIHWMDESGNEVTFTRGQVWIMAVEPSVSVTWTPSDTAVQVQ